MFEIVAFGVFFGGLVFGAVIADHLHKLPTAEELQAEDQARIAKFAKS